MVESKNIDRKHFITRIAAVGFGVVFLPRLWGGKRSETKKVSTLALASPIPVRKDPRSVQQSEGLLV